MTTFGDLGLGGGFQKIGRGFDVRELPPRVERWFKSFRRGYVAMDSAAHTPDDASPLAVDLKVDRRDRIAPMAGVEIVETLENEPVEVFTHAGLDGQTELVFIAPPYIGVRDPFAGTMSWFNAGLAASRYWVAVNHGGTLVFSDGETDVYTKEIGVNAVGSLDWGPAKTLASFAGRIIAGNTYIGGVLNVLGFKWTGASGEPEDITGIGNGWELLLADVAQGDEIVAIRTSGFDSIVFLLRKSVWIGRRTGDPFRPVDVAPMIPGLGCVIERSAINVLGGVAWLSDAGVEFFDGQGYKHLSSQIDADLLPLDLTDTGQYRVVYSALDKTLTLFLADKSWIYSFEFDRWYRSTLTADTAVSLFNPQANLEAGMLAGWGEFWSGYWSEMPPEVEVLQSGDLIYTKGDKLGVEVRDSRKFWGVDQQRYWRLPEDERMELDRLVDLMEIEILFQGAGTLEIELLLSSGEYVPIAQVALDAGSGRDARRRLKLHRTVKELTAGLRMVEGDLRIGAIRMAGRLGRELAP